jgi:hypothetical protein
MSKKRRIAALLALALLSSTLFALVPAQGLASTTLLFAGDLFKITRNGKTFVVRIEASKASSDRFDLYIERTKDPKGKVWSFASERWGHDISEFSANDNLSDGKLHATQAEMDPHGRLNLDWAANDTLKSSCGGHNHSRRGTFNGVFRFVTGTAKFGTITRPSLPGVLKKFDNSCPTPPGSTSCPHDNIHGTQPGTVYFEASKNTGARTAHYAASTYGTDVNGWGRSEFAETKVPAFKFTLDSSTSHGSAKGARDSFMHGTTVFSGGAPTDGSPVACGDSKQYSTRRSTGQWSRDLKATFLLGTRRIGGGGDPGTAERTTTEPAP